MANGRYITVESTFGVSYRRYVLGREGHWVVHRGIVGDPEGFNVTHEPTKLAAVRGIQKLACARRAALEFSRLPGNWLFASADQMSKRQKQAGLRLKRKYYALRRGDGDRKPSRPERPGKS